MRTKTIKSVLWLMSFFGIVLFFASCHSASHVAKYDEIYSSSRVEAIRVVEKPVSVVDNNATKVYSSQDVYPQTYNLDIDNQLSDANSTYSTTSVSADGSNTYITNNYFSTDAYSDYAYAARIKRFYSPVCGWSYYDDYYTNMYWYTHNPYNWGTSIYLGYSWWSPSVSINYGWGYPYYYNSCYYPYNSYHHHHSYWGYSNYTNGWYNGYYTGYYNGYNDGYYGNYYNSYDRNSRYYRPIRGLHGSDGSTRGYYGSRNKVASAGYESPRNSRNQTFGDYYESRTGQRRAENNRYYEGRPGSSLNSGTTGRNTMGSSRGENAAVRSNGGTTGRTNTGTTNGRYNKPEEVTTSRNQNTTSTTGRGASVNTSTQGRTEINTSNGSRNSYYKDNTTPSRGTATTTPSRSNDNSRGSYSAPSRNSDRGSYSAPSRGGNSSDSYSSPSRSSDNSRGSYSQPSRESNSGSYSAPSRSGSSSGSSSSPSRGGGSSSSSSSSSPSRGGGSGSSSPRR